MARESPFQRGPVAVVYVLNASANPDRVECRVPWALDEEEIFFGPCKKTLRQHLKKHLLRDAQEAAPPHDIYVLGVNGLGGGSVRKVVWAGRIKRLMPFARAAEVLRGGRYEQLWGLDTSPLHVEPEYREGELVGYRWRPGSIHEGDWVRDLTSKERSGRLSGDLLQFLPGSSPCEVFDRDLCFLTENFYYATGRGLEIDATLLDLLHRAQPGVRGIDARAIFGRTGTGTVNGKRGSYLLISEPGSVGRLRSWLDRAAPAKAGAPTQPRRSRRCG